MEDSLKQAISTYNKVAEIYSKYLEENILQFQLSNFESLVTGKKILDAACAAGRDSNYFAEDGYEVTGIDASEELIKQAKKKYKKPEFLVEDLRNIKYKNEFDGIWALSALVHSNREDCKKVLKNFYNALSKNGILFLSAKEGTGKREIKKLEVNNEPLTYYFYTQEEFEAMVTDSGLKIISSEITKDPDSNVLEIFARKD